MKNETTSQGTPYSRSASGELGCFLPPLLQNQLGCVRNVEFYFLKNLESQIPPDRQKSAQVQGQLGGSLSFQWDDIFV